MITMLAMLLVLSSSTCSGSSDDDEINGGSAPSSSFSITYDGKKTDVELTEWINPIFGNGGSKKGNYFCFDNYPLPSGQIHIIFPYSQYGENVQPSHFPVGYSDFDEDGEPIPISAYYRNLKGFRHLGNSYIPAWLRRRDI